MRAARAVDRLQDLRAARADQSGQPHDLARPHRERDPGELPGPGQPVDLQDGVPGGGGGRRERVLGGAAGHQPDDLGGRRRAGREVAGDRPPVLEDRDPVADLADLGEPVGDVDDGDPVGGQLAHDPEQVLHLVRVEHRRRLVHDDQPGVAGQRPGHADDLLARGGQPAQLAARRDLRVPEAAQQRAGGVLGVAGTGETQPRRFVAEHDVLRDAQARDQVELLVDRRDPGGVGGLRGAEHDGLPRPPQLAGVGPVGPGEHLDQRRLAGAVLPQQAVHLARGDVEVDAVERADPREVLDDAPHLQQHGGNVEVLTSDLQRQNYVCPSYFSVEIRS